ncbi:MAG: tetratricopeptide repeat protein [Gammaproteobacteria bacterium]|nr:tetratricopeptide repeat protein [Gammaproteobacteria bacterium]
MNLRSMSSVKRLAGLLLTAVLLSGCGGATDPVRPRTDAPPPPAPITGAKGGAAATAAALVDPAAQADYDRALKAMQDQKFGDAETIFFELVKNHPDYAGPYANIGILFKRKGKNNEAEQAFKKSLELNKENADVYNHLAILYRDQGKFDLARQTYEAGLQIAPAHPHLNLNLGILLDLYLNQPEKALGYFQTAQKLNPDDKQIKIWLADIQKRLIAKH